VRHRLLRSGERAEHRIRELLRAPGQHVPDECGPGYRGKMSRSEKGVSPSLTPSDTSPSAARFPGCVLPLPSGALQHPPSRKDPRNHPVPRRLGHSDGCSPEEDRDRHTPLSGHCLPPGVPRPAIPVPEGCLPEARSARRVCYRFKDCLHVNPLSVKH